MGALSRNLQIRADVPHQEGSLGAACIGPSYEIGGARVAFEGQQFPIEAFDQFALQGVPRG